MEYWLTHCATICRPTLKKNLYRDLVKIGRTGDSSDTKSDVAERHGLRVVRGKVSGARPSHRVPDPKHELSRIDLELATEHYRFKNIAKRFAQALPSTPARRTHPISPRTGTAGNHCGDS